MPDERSPNLEMVRAIERHDAKALAEAMVRGADSNAELGAILAPDDPPDPYADPKPLSLLHITSIEGPVEIVQILIRHGAELEARDSLGNTPLHCLSVATCSPEEASRIAEVLIAAGADVNARDADGRTPLDHAASTRREALARTLKAAGGTYRRKRYKSWVERLAGESRPQPPCELG